MFLFVLREFKNIYCQFLLNWIQRDQAIKINNIHTKVLISERSFQVMTVTNKKICCYII